jgi:DNA ligase-1
MAHRLTGSWQPTETDYLQLLSGDGVRDPGRPYPFYLAYTLEQEPEALGDIAEWQAEWKWDGIRAQVIKRADQILIWSRGEELVTERFPEIATACKWLPDGTVLDGEILAWKDTAPLPFAVLQRRIGRSKLGARILADAPVVFLVFDVLEHDGADARALPLSERRVLLERIVADTSVSALRASPLIHADSWDDLALLRGNARERAVEGVMLKRKTSEYGVGRKRGDWWKWKIEPFAIDAVLMYAQRGSGRRASLYTDYTFGVWHEGALVPVAKAYSGLTDAEIRRVDRFVRNNTIEKFGPVRSVTPSLVFEIAFEGIQSSTRHRAGVALRFPRMARWREDKKAAEADTLAALQELMKNNERAGNAPRESR